MEITKAIYATAENAQYDRCAKRLLSNKIILANILTRTVEEFKGMNPYEVVTLIEGVPFIGEVPVDPGLTNATHVQTGERLRGFNTEDNEVNEGYVSFDVICYVRLKSGLSQIIVNVEAQKDNPTEYNVVNRAEYYTCRLISSQKDRDFVNCNYDDIKSVYSIWVCMNMKQDCMNYIHLTNDALIGDFEWGGNLDLINIFMIGLSRSIADEEYELHRMLGVLFTNELSEKDKLDILNEEFEIVTKDLEEIKKEMGTMCNLSMYFLEQGLERGIEQGIEQGIERGKVLTILKLLDKGRLNMEEGAEELSCTISELERLMAEEGFMVPICS